MTPKILPHIHRDHSERFPGRGLAFAAGGASVLMLLGAGGLLWWRHGDAVFTEIALAGLAWCF